MQALIERCCGLDVHQETVVACLLIGAAGARARKQVRTFCTVRRELEALRDWLKAAGVTHVGMESTGVYWRPVYAVLEGHVELIVGNARHIYNVSSPDGTDQPGDAGLVRKDANHIGPPFDLLVQAFQRVGGMQLGPVLGWESHVGEHVMLAVVH